MKVSEKEKILTRVKILEASVDVMSEKGFKSASMREIAKRAGIGDATIYSYFPNKEKLLYGYCEYVQQQAREELISIPNFHEFSLREQLQQLVETELQIWLPAREYLQEVFELTFASPVAGYSQLENTRKQFTEMVSDLLEAAIEAGEIPEQPYHDMIPRLFWDYMNGVLSYWLKDTSEDFSNTTKLVDQSMGIIESILQTGLFGKSMELMSFLFRTHIFQIFEMMGEGGAGSRTSKAKRSFMENKNES